MPLIRSESCSQDVHTKPSVQCGQLADNQTSQLPGATHNAARDHPKLQSVEAKTQAIENRRYWTCVESETRAMLGKAQSVCFFCQFLNSGQCLETSEEHSIIRLSKYH